MNLLLIIIHLSLCPLLLLCCFLLGASGFRALSRSLESNNILVHIDLGHNNLGPEGAKLVANYLNQNTTLQSINLEWNKIQSEGFTSIIEALYNNSNSALIHLDVHSNEIESEGAVVCSISVRLSFPFIS